MPPLLQTDIPEQLDRVGRWLLRRRRLLASLLFSVAAGLTVQQLVPATEIQVDAVVARSDLPAGSVLEPEDLTVVRLPPRALPRTTYAAAAPLVGRQLAGALREGSIITDADVVGPGLLAGAPPGAVAVPLRPADPSTVQLVGAGQRIDIAVSTGSDFAESARTKILAKGVVVLWTSSGSPESGLVPTGDRQGLVVVAAEADQAAALAGASSSGQVHMVLVGPGTGTEGSPDG